MDNTKFFAERLKKLRKELKLSQRELCGNLGINKAMVFYWELGNRSPNLEDLAKLCKFFSVSADYLIGLKDFE